MPTDPTIPPRTHRMDGLRIEEISGVDFPAHLADGWLVLKSRSPSHPSKEATVPINKDALDPDIREHIDSLEAEVTKAREDQAAAEAALAEAEKTPPVVEEEEDVLKSLPEPVRKMLEDANARAEAAESIALAEQDNRLTSEFVAKARDLDALSVEPTEFGKVLKTLAEKAPEETATVFTVLKAANAAVAEAGAFRETGTVTTSATSGDAYSEIEKIAKARVDAGEADNLAEAIAKVAAEQPDLYRQHLSESRKGA